MRKFLQRLKPLVSFSRKIMNNGILYIVFGEKYEKLAVNTIAYSRQFTNLPFYILTNIKNRNNKWKNISNITFKEFNLPIEQNRDIKTTMIDYSPFDSTLYLDCDSIITKPGIENVFDIFKNNDLLFTLYGIVDASNQVNKYYVATMKKLHISFPLTIYYGAIIGFNKTDQTKFFFSQWNKNWKEIGITREMPALACTMKLNRHLNAKVIKLTDNIFAWPINPNAIIQHEYGKGEDFWKPIFPDLYNS